MITPKVGGGRRGTLGERVRQRQLATKREAERVLAERAHQKRQEQLREREEVIRHYQNYNAPTTDDPLEDDHLDNLQRLVAANKAMLQQEGYERHEEERARIPARKRNIAGRVGGGFDPSVEPDQPMGQMFDKADKAKLFGGGAVGHAPIHLQRDNNKGETERERRLRERRERFAARNNTNLINRNFAGGGGREANPSVGGPPGFSEPTPKAIGMMPTVGSEDKTPVSQKSHFSGMMLGNNANPGNARDTMWERKRRAFQGRADREDDQPEMNFSPPEIALRSPIRPNARPIEDEEGAGGMVGQSAIPTPNNRGLGGGPAGNEFPIRPKPLDINPGNSPAWRNGGGGVPGGFDGGRGAAVAGAPGGNLLASELRNDPLVSKFMQNLPSNKNPTPKRTPGNGGGGGGGGAFPFGASESLQARRKKEKQAEYARQLQDQMRMKEGAGNRNRRGRWNNNSNDGGGMGGVFGNHNSHNNNPSSRPRRKSHYAEELEQQIQEKEEMKRRERESRRRESAGMWKDRLADPDPTNPAHAPQFRKNLAAMHGGFDERERAKQEAKRQAYLRDLDEQVRLKKERQRMERDQDNRDAASRTSKGRVSWDSKQHIREITPRGQYPAREQPPRTTNNTVGFGPGASSPTADAAKSAKMRRQEQYRRELEAQMKQKESKKRRELENRRREKMEEANMVYDPWGKGGGGAPHRDSSGAIVTNMRQAKRDRKIEIQRRSFELESNSPVRGGGQQNYFSQPRAHDSPVRPRAQDEGRFHDAGGGGDFGIGAARGGLGGDDRGAVNNRRHGRGLADLGGGGRDSAALARRRKYCDELAQQIKEKEERKRREKEKKRLEDERDERNVREYIPYGGQKKRYKPEGGKLIEKGETESSLFQWDNSILYYKCLFVSMGSNGRRDPNQTASSMEGNQRRGGGVLPGNLPKDPRPSQRDNIYFSFSSHPLLMREQNRRVQQQLAYREELKRQADDAKRRKKEAEERRKREDEALEAKIKRDLRGGGETKLRGRSSFGGDAANAKHNGGPSNNVSPKMSNKKDLFGGTVDASNVPPGLDGNDNNTMGGLAGDGPIIPNANPIVGEVNQNLEGMEAGFGRMGMGPMGIPGEGGPVAGMGGMGGMMGGGGAGMMGGLGGLNMVLQEVKAMKQEQIATNQLLQRQAMDKLQKEAEEAKKETEKAKEELRKIREQIQEKKQAPTPKASDPSQDTFGSAVRGLRRRRISSRPTTAAHLEQEQHHHNLPLPEGLQLRQSVAMQLGVLKDLNIRLDESVMVDGKKSLGRGAREERGLRLSRKKKPMDALDLELHRLSNKSPKLLGPQSSRLHTANSRGTGNYKNKMKDNRPWSQETYSDFSKSIRGGKYPVLVSTASRLMESLTPKTRKSMMLDKSMKGISELVPFEDDGSIMHSSLRSQTKEMTKVLKSLQGRSEFVYPEESELSMMDASVLGHDGTRAGRMPESKIDEDQTTPVTPETEFHVQRPTDATPRAAAAGPGTGARAGAGLTNHNEQRSSRRQPPRRNDRPPSEGNPSLINKPMTPSAVGEPSRVGTPSTLLGPDIDIDRLMPSLEDKLRKLEEADKVQQQPGELQRTNSQQKADARDMIAKFLQKDKPHRPNSRYDAKQSVTSVNLSVAPTPTRLRSNNDVPNLAGESRWVNASVMGSTNTNPTFMEDSTGGGLISESHYDNNPHRLDNVKNGGGDTHEEDPNDLIDSLGSYNPPDDLYK
eukprot:jgi/Bigna1/66497/fgenesh1_pg.1_\